MKNYSITYYNKTADTIDVFKISAVSLNQAVLRLRQKRIRFTIETIEVN